MAENKGSDSPGTKPDVKTGKLRPTVIGTLGSGMDKVNSPAGAAARSEAEHDPAPRVFKPTALPGVERKRIPVTMEDLKKLSPGTGPDALDQALRLIETYVAETATDRTAILWGQQSQEDYSNLVSENLSLSQAESLVRAAGYLNRMMAILRSIDIEAVAGDIRRGGAISEYLKGMNDKIDTVSELESARIELDQLVKMMSAALGELLNLKERIEKQSRRIDEIGDAVEAAALAAQFLSDYENRRSPDLARRFFERGMSLTQSAVQIRGSTTVRRAQIEQPLRLIEAIQNVALVTLPGWLGSIASLSVLFRGDRKLTPTEAGELARQLRNIVEQLQT